MKLALNPTTHLCAFGLRDIRPNCQKLSGQESSSLVWYHKVASQHFVGLKPFYKCMDRPSMPLNMGETN